MTLLNPFAPRIRALFVHDDYCFDCGRYPADGGINHIHGRGKTKRNKIMASVFNAIPLCLPCHSKGTVTSRETRERYSHLISDFLIEMDYEPTELDQEFLNYISKQGYGYSFLVDDEV